MEFSVYDGASRRVGPILIVGLAMGMLAAFSTLLLTAQGATRIRNGLFLVLLFPAAIILALSAVISLMMSVQIRILSHVIQSGNWNVSPHDEILTYQAGCSDIP
jgi:hypothetical protein